MQPSPYRVAGAHWTTQWPGIGLTLILAVAPFSDAARAEVPLQATAQTITGEFLTPPKEFEPSTEFTIAQQAPVIDLVQIPVPDTPADPWSIWGYALLHSNGKFYVPVGDHRGIDANSYLYEYDPQAKTVELVANLQDAAKQFHQGDFGFGKVHGRLNEGETGEIYFATYWGQWQKDSDRYEGDRVFKFDPMSRELFDLGMPLFGWGYPSTHMDTRRGLFYAEAHQRKGNRKGDPNNNYLANEYNSYKDPYHVKFLVYDVSKQKVIFHGGHEGLSYGRDFFVDAQGNAYWNDGEGRLEKYNPETNAVSKVQAKLPGESLRRTLGPDDQGLLYGVAHDTHKLFSFDPRSQKCQTITTVWADSPGMDVTDDGKYIYYIPGGHGPSSGTPLVQVDVAQGTQKVIAFLHETVWQQTNFNLGGTYCLQISKDGGTAYVGFNGKVGDRKKSWGGLAVVTVQIPSGER